MRPCRNFEEETVRLSKGSTKSRMMTNMDSSAQKLFNLISALMLISLLIAPAACGEEDETTAISAITGNYSDRGADVDGDGLYDLLIVDAEVFVSEPGEYSLMGFLYTLKGDEVVWSIDHAKLEPGNQTMLLEFDGKTIEKSGLDGPYRLKKVLLSSGSSQSGQDICDYVPEAYRTQPYNSSEFTDPVRSEKTVSGTGSGELLLTFTVEDAAPVFSSRYSYDIVGINIPPISNSFKIIPLKGLEGRIYELPNVTMAAKPNNFTVTAEGVENLNIGLKKPQGERIRTWISTMVEASEEGVATSETDLISPGSYHVKIFGAAAENATQVNLTMTMEKKLIIDGKFSLGIDTTGFPSGNYSVNAKAQNGSFSLDEIEIGGLSIVD